MLNYKRYFKEKGMDMALTVFWGKYRGKNYPDAYIDEERKYYEYVVKWTPSKEVEEITEVISVNNRDEKQLYNLKPIVSFKKLCKAGCNYAVIRVDGTVNRCGQLEKPVLGNLFEKNVKLLKKPKECGVKYCRCAEFEYTEKNKCRRQLL